MRNYNFQEIEAAGFTAGLNSAKLSCIACPFDGRTKEGRSWWAGFMRGDQERCRRAQAELLRRVQDAFLEAFLCSDRAVPADLEAARYWRSGAN